MKCRIILKIVFDNKIKKHSGFKKGHFEGPVLLGDFVNLEIKAVTWGWEPIRLGV